MLTRTVSVIRSLPKPCVLKQVISEGEAEPIIGEAQEIFAFLFSLRCQVYYDSLHRWIKTSKIRGKSGTDWDSDFRAALQDAGFM